MAPSHRWTSAVHDRLRVHHHVDPVVRGGEQVMGLDQLQALVHQRRRVDRDLPAHVPSGVGQRLGDGHVLQVGAVTAAERTAGGGEHQALHGPRRLAADELGQRRVLGVHGHDAGAGGLGQGRDQLAADDERLLVGQREVDALPQRRHCWSQARGTDQGVEHEVGARLDHEAHEPLRAGQDLPVRPGLGGPRRCVLVGECDPADAVAPRHAHELLPRALRRQPYDVELGRCLDDLEGLGPDRAGGPEDEHASHPPHVRDGRPRGPRSTPRCLRAPSRGPCRPRRRSHAPSGASCHPPSCPSAGCLRSPSSCGCASSVSIAPPVSGSRL